MNYKKYDLFAYQIHCVKIDKFRESQIIVNFKRKAKKEDITMRTLLSKVLMESSKKYPTSRQIAIETENLYNAAFGSGTYLSGNYSVISFDCVMLNDEWVEENLFEQCVAFLLELIMNPHIEDGEFFEKSFNLAKASLEQEIKSIKDNPRQYGTIRLYEEIDSNSVAAYNGIGYLDDLEKITAKDLYQYYKTMLTNDLVDIFIISPKEPEDVKEMISSKFKLNVFKKQGESHFVSYNKYRKKNKIVHEKSDFKQSKIFVACKFDKLTDFERKYVSTIYSYILGGGPSSKLFTTVREGNSLCYSISSSFKGIYQFLIISAGINAKDFKKCLRLIKQELKNMAQGKFEEEKIDEAKITYLNSFKELKDLPDRILGTYVSHEYLDSDLIEEREQKIKEVTKEMIVEFAKKLHVDTVYVLEGSDCDE